MKYYIASFTIGFHLIVLLANAEEQILFVSKRDGNQEIYRQVLGGRLQRLTFEPGSDLDPALSPDGTKMAYVSTINRNFEITVMELKSRKRQQLTFEFKSDLHPTWSPDGKRIAFASDRDGNFDIYIMDAAGENITQMTDNFPWDDSWPHWSPVSEEIVFISDRRGGTADVYLLDVQTGDQKQLTNFDYRTNYPKWSPGGTKIAFSSAIFEEIQSGSLLIWRMKPDGTDLEALVVDGVINDQPTFSPNGEWLTFMSTKDKNVEIYSMNIDTQQIIRLTNHPEVDYQPDWSPDGERIAFVSHRDGNPDIYTMTVNGEQLTNLTKSGMTELSPAWSPDGDKIAFGRRMGDNSVRIYVIGSNGKNEIKLVDLPFVNRFPAWAPRGDKLAFVNYPERGTRRARIYTVDSDGQNLQMLHENPEEIKEIAWSHDGTQVLFNQIGSRIGYLDTATHEVHPVNLPVRNIDTPDWSPNGQEIIFSARLQSGFPKSLYGIFIIDRDGNSLQTVLMDTRPLGTNGLAWSPGGDKILFGRESGLYTLDLTSETIELFLESASAPDWQDPSRPRSVSPRNRLKTTWGEIKKRDKR